MSEWVVVLRFLLLWWILWPKGTWKRKRVVLLTLAITEGSQGRNSYRVGTWRQELSGAAYSLAFHSLLCLLSYRSQNHQPRGSITQSRLGPLMSFRGMLHGLACGLLWERCVLGVPPSSQVTTQHSPWMLYLGFNSVSGPYTPKGNHSRKRS